MATDTPSGTEATLQNIVRDQGRNLMWVGGLVALLGVVAIVFPVFSSFTIGIVFGAALTIVGVVHVAHAFSAPGWKGALGEIVLAVIFLIAGVGMLVNPVVALTSLTLLLVLYFVAEGLGLLFFAWSLRDQGHWIWSAGAGVLSLALAALLWVGYPSTAAWALGLLFGVNLLGTGVSMIVVGRSASKGADTGPATTAPPGTGA
ncbi:MAG: HdeD family acid-resistance protein [Salinigranum sp.]